MEKFQVLIVDDHPLFRKGLRVMLEAMHDMEVVGEATTAQEAIKLASEMQPDIVLMDLQLPGGSGLDATREITQVSPHIRVLVVTLFEDDDSIFTALRSGARGYILKDTKEEMMMRAVRTVSSGEAIFSEAIAAHLIDYFSSSKKLIPRGTFPELTRREDQILELIAKGFSNQGISENLSISLKTVRNHVSNIFSKLQVADRVQAVIKARETGLHNASNAGREPHRHP
jgi:DNA-binding NarL/FixJ family response regulator